MRPLLLDLYCKAGGCSVGYHRAGFDVVGVDIEPQPRYPFPFCEGDALELLDCLLRGGYFRTSEQGPCLYLENLAAIHASPPCQRYSQASRISGNSERHPDLVAPTRELLTRTGKLWVIENVPGAPLIRPALLCGLALGCGVKRHRLFESNVLLFGTTCPLGHRGDYISVFGHSVGEKVGGKGWVSVHGGGAPKTADRRRRASAELAAMAMGIDWMIRDELSQAIPPAYTEFIGRQLLNAISDTPLSPQ